MKSSARLLLAIAALIGASTGSAAIVSADFSTFTNGNLVGQNGWARFNTSANAPIQVTDGKVTWAGLSPAAVDNQDAFLPFASTIAQPASGTTLLYLALRLSVASAGANTSYFAALNTNQTASSASFNFQNARLVAKDNGGTFDFGCRVNGQTGYPFVYGNEGLDYGTTYNLVARISMVSGNANDKIDLFVAATTQAIDFDLIYASSIYTSGTITDPSFGALLLSQFASTTTTQAGVSLNKVLVTSDFAEVQSFVSVSAIPEPSTYAVLVGGLTLAGVILARRRRT